MLCPPPGDLPNPGIEPSSPASSALEGGFFTSVQPVKAMNWEDTVEEVVFQIVSICLSFAHVQFFFFFFSCSVFLKYLQPKGPPQNIGALTGQCKSCKRCGVDPWVGKITCKRKWQPTPVFFLGKSHGQRLLAGYSPWGHKESDTAEHTHTYINKAKSSTVSFLNPVILITVPTKHLDQIQRAVKWGRSRGVRRTSEKQTIKLLCCKYTNARMASSKEWESIPIVLTHNTLQ